MFKGPTYGTCERGIHCSLSHIYLIYKKRDKIFFLGQTNIYRLFNRDPFMPPTISIISL